MAAFTLVTFTGRGADSASLCPSLRAGFAARRSVEAEGRSFRVRRSVAAWGKNVKPGGGGFGKIADDLPAFKAVEQQRTRRGAKVFSRSQLKMHIK